MKDRTPRRTAGEPEVEGPARFRSLLVPVDLTPISDRVLARVSLLPLADRARITLLHVVPEGLPYRARRTAEHDAKATLADEAKSLARALPGGAGVEVRVRVGAAAAQIAAAAASTGAELIVMGRGGGRALRDVFLGSTAERVVRAGLLPVLVVRLPARARYARPAIALDLDQVAADALALLLRVIPKPPPSVALIHAAEPPSFSRLTYPSLSADDVESARRETEQNARRGLRTLLAGGLARARIRPGDAPAWNEHVRCGSARRVIEKAVATMRTDLLVLGTHGHTSVAQMFLGTVAGDVLREVSCDVLVVPPAPDAVAPVRGATAAPRDS